MFDSDMEEAETLVCNQTIRHNKSRSVVGRYICHTGTLDISSTTTASPLPVHVLPTLPFLVCATFHPLILLLFLSSSSLAPCAARGLSDQSSRTPDRKERKANSAGKKRRRSPSPPSTPAESRKKGGKKG